MKLNKFYLIESIVISLLVLVIWLFTSLINDERVKLQHEAYKEEAAIMQKRISEMILNKQKSTVAIALAIATNKVFVDDIAQNNIKPNYYEELVLRLKEHTLYKNIWIHIIDKDLNSVYESWSKKHGENLRDARKDLVAVFKSKRTSYSVSAGRYDLSIKAMIPVFKNYEIVGIVEVVSHFNSISKQVKKFNVDSVVVLKKEYNKYLKYPFTNIFMGEYYVANFDAPDNLMSYLKTQGVENYFDNTYKIENDNLIVSYELKDIENRPIGYYIMFKKLTDISSTDLDFFVFKWLSIGGLILLLMGATAANVISQRNKKQKTYYKNIIDASLNIVIIVDKKKIIDVNKVLLKYFYKYNSIEEFIQEGKLLSDFFVEEEGYIKKDMDGLLWIDYLIQNPHEYNKVKIKYFDKEYYFTVSASLISKEKNHYSAIFSDITKEEMYQKELEHINITDSLTQIGNRHHYNEQIVAEISRANRYVYSLSLIIFDIDYFKKVNDIHGHDIGDKVLIEYSKLVASHLRESDTFCRIGGEEFMIILPHSNRADAYKIAQKLRKEIEESKAVLPITASFGVIEYVRGDDAEFTFKRADEALYEAKNAGRNRVVVR